MTDNIKPPLVVPLDLKGPPEPRHCDDFINDLDQPDCLRWFLLVNRMPVTDSWLAIKMTGNPKLFADYKGKRVRVVMASRLGDVGITADLSKEHGYERRVGIESLSNFSKKPRTGKRALNL